MMARSKAQLRIVDTPEAVLTDLFAQEAQLASAAHECRRQIDAARIAYGNAHRLMALPRVELLRTRFGPQSRGPTQ